MRRIRHYFDVTSTPAFSFFANNLRPVNKDISLVSRNRRYVRNRILFFPNIFRRNIFSFGQPSRVGRNATLCSTVDRFPCSGYNVRGWYLLGTRTAEFDRICRRRDRTGRNRFANYREISVNPRTADWLKV